MRSTKVYGVQVSHKCSVSTVENTLFTRVEGYREGSYVRGVSDMLCFRAPS